MTALTEHVYPRPGNQTEKASKKYHRTASHGNHYGRARRRQLIRQRRKRWFGDILRGFALVWLLCGAILPLVFYSYTISQAAQTEYPFKNHSTRPRLTDAPIYAIMQGPLPTTLAPTFTETPTSMPTATPTPTPLPPILIQATAWQATLDTALGYSRATQTQAAGQYAATQTSLPPVLTANALERSVTATAAEQ